VVRTVSWPPSASLGSSVGASARHRWRHVYPVPRLRCIWRVTWHGLAPASNAQRILARRPSRWGRVCRRAICSKQARCRAVSGPLGEAAGDGAMAVGIRNAFRETWALLSPYDTMPPSVRILLPSTTRALAKAAGDSRTRPAGSATPDGTRDVADCPGSRGCGTRQCILDQRGHLNRKLRF
jgi:hypothetical protein